MTATVVRLPPGFVEAADADPGDSVWRWAAVDWLTENGEEAAAEGLRWLTEKKRSPYRNDVGWTVRWDWPGETIQKPLCGAVPESLVDAMIDVLRGIPPKTAADFFAQFLTAWCAATPELRKVWWQWQPPHTSEDSGR